MVGQKGIDLKIGQTVHYKSRSMQHPEATYEGIVIGCYKYFYEVMGKPLSKTMHEKNEGIYGEPKPYKFCISKYLDTSQERVMVIKDVSLDELAERIA